MHRHIYAGEAGNFDFSNKRGATRYFILIQDVMEQTSPAPVVRVNMWPAAIDPCLQIVDYCSWAIQRK